MISTKPTLTNAGRALLIRALAGETLTFTRMALGSGSLASGQDPDDLTALIAEEMSITPATLDTSQAGLLGITGDFNSENVPRDFKWRELGIYAKGSEDNIELLYAYANDGENAGTLKAITTDILTEQTITVVVEVTGVEDVSAIFNPHPSYAPATTLTGHMNNKNNPHQVTKQQVGLGNVPNLAPSNMTITYIENNSNALTGNPFHSGQTIGTFFYYLHRFCNTFFQHVWNYSNPHRVSKSQVGLGNVVNVSPNNMAPTFTEADEQENLDDTKDLISGNTMTKNLGKIAAAVHLLYAHLANKSNPHEVTKAQVGLENVENTAPSFNVINFESRNTFAVPETGETMATIMSKIAKALTDLQTHVDTANTINPHGVKLSQIAAVGTFTGDGTQGKTISLSFTPAAVLLYDEFGRTYNASKGVCGGLAKSDRGIRVPNSSTTDDATTWSNTYTALMCVENGFKVNYLSGQTAEDSIDTNENNVVYHYVAFK